MGGQGEEPTLRVGGSRGGAAGGPRAGSRIDRFVLLRPVGAGGMGQVFAAYDPQLERQVAIKLVAPGAGEDEGARLLREGQAMARLSHPNVITIYEVGLHDGDVFIAMELVEGVDLRRWLADEPRSWRDIRTVFVQAGRGLAAAHAAGMVHRDFKPANVLVGTDGRVRVVDFGIAATALPADDLVDDGAGTPAYMAPERLEGRAADARADQYSFCVALYEAIHGRLPYAESAITTVGEARRRSPAAIPAPRGRRWLRRLLARGLATDADLRPASMTELVDALARGGRAGRRLAVGAAIASGLVIAGLAVSAGGRDQAADPCARAADPWHRVWSSETHERLARAHAEDGAAARALTSAGAALDAYGERWRATRLEACRQTHVAGTQSGALLDLRMTCLDRRLDTVAAFVDLLSAADAATMRAAPEAALALPDLELCSQPELLTAPLPVPAEAATRRAVTELQQRLARCAALRGAGRDEEALETADAVLAEAEALGYSPLIAEAHYCRADALDARGSFPEARAAGFAALTAAQRGRHESYIASSLALLVWIDGHSLGDLDSATEWFELGRATLDRLEQPGSLEADLWSRLASAEIRAGRAERALEHTERALELRRQSQRPDDLDVLKEMNNLANAYYTSGRYQDALDLHREVRGRFEAILGEQHAMVAQSLDNAGAAQLALGQPAAASSSHAAALRINRAVQGEDSFFTIASLYNLAEAELEQGSYREALPRLTRVMARFEALFGANHAMLAHPLTSLGLAHLGLGEHDRAIDYLERARDLMRAAASFTPAQSATNELRLGRALWESGRDRPRGLDLVKRAHRSLLEHGGPPHQIAKAGAWLIERGVAP